MEHSRFFFAFWNLKSGVTKILKLPLNKINFHLLQIFIFQRQNWKYGIFQIFMFIKFWSDKKLSPHLKNPICLTPDIQFPKGKSENLEHSRFLFCHLKVKIKSWLIQIYFFFFKFGVTKIFNLELRKVKFHLLQIFLLQRQNW